MIGQGLQVSLAGLAVTFGALAALMLIMVVLVEGFSRSEKAKRGGKETPTADPVADEIVAAVAAALSTLGPNATRYEGLGACLGAGPGAWWRENAPAHPDALPARGARS